MIWRVQKCLRYKKKARLQIYFGDCKRVYVLFYKETDRTLLHLLIDEYNDVSSVSSGDTCVKLPYIILTVVLWNHVSLNFTVCPSQLNDKFLLTVT